MTIPECPHCDGGESVGCEYLGAGVWLCLCCSRVFKSHPAINTLTQVKR